MTEHACLTAEELLHAPCTTLVALLGARVCVQSAGATHEGVLYCIDPETRAVTLLEGPASLARDGPHAAAVRVVLVQALTRLTVLAPAACETPAVDALQLWTGASSGEQRASAPPYDEAEAQSRRASVADVLTQNHVPWEHTADGGLLILGCLTLVWPFTSEAMTCPNARVLERVAPLLDAALQQRALEQR